MSATSRARAGNKVVLSVPSGDHGTKIMIASGEPELEMRLALQPVITMGKRSHAIPGGLLQCSPTLTVLLSATLLPQLDYVFAFITTFASQAGAHGIVLLDAASSSTSPGASALLGLGFIFGLKHATEVDHVVAVSTIVSERRNVLRSALVGGLWGAGHTASLVIVGTIVLALRIAIPESVSSWLELCVALMIIGLGTTALVRTLRRGRAKLHIHRHRHHDVSHVHVHFHEHGTEHTGPVSSHSHAVSSVGLKPLLVGAMHGLAGSAALTLLVLTQIESAALAILYLAVFGIGSIIGMLLMSGLVGLPFALSARWLSGFNHALQTIAATLSIAFGFWYAYETGVVKGLWGTAL